MRKTAKCKYCDKEISLQNINKHHQKHEAGNFKHRLSIPVDVIRDIDGNFTCWICGNCKSLTKAGILSHVWRKHTSDGKMMKSQKGRSAWNKGLTKENNNIIAEMAHRQSIRQKEEFSCGKRVPNSPGLEFRLKMSVEQSIHNRGGKCKWFVVNGIKVQGTWERDIAEMLTKADIEWNKPSTNNDIWKYVDANNKQRSYAPDFYLPAFNVWLETKGYWWGSDREKMKLIAAQYPHRNLLIIEHQDFIAIKNNFQILIDLIHQKLI